MQTLSGIPIQNRIEEKRVRIQCQPPQRNDTFVIFLPFLQKKLLTSLSLRRILILYSDSDIRFFSMMIPSDITSLFSLYSSSDSSVLYLGIRRCIHISRGRSHSSDSPLFPSSYIYSSIDCKEDRIDISWDSDLTRANTYLTLILSLSCRKIFLHHGSNGLMLIHI
jgi:hypothetical protein